MSKPSDMLVGWAIFMLIAVGGGIMLIEANKSSPNIIDPVRFSSLMEAVNKTDALNQNVTSLQEKFTSKSNEQPNILDVIYFSGYTTLTNLLSVFLIGSGIVTDTARILGFIIPEWVSGIIIMLMTVTLIFAIVGALMNRDL